MQLFSTITLADIQDGAPGPAGASGGNYDLIFNKDKIIKYKEYDNIKKEYNTIISPSNLEFYLISRENENESILKNTEYAISMSFITMPKVTGEIEKCTFFSSLNNNLEFTGIDTVLSCIDETTWQLQLQSLLNVNALTNTYNIGEEVYIVFHTSSEATNFDKTLVLGSISDDSEVYIGFYYPKIIFDTTENIYTWEPIPDDFNKYCWRYYGIKSSLIDSQNEQSYLLFLNEIKKSSLQLYAISKFLVHDEIILLFEIFKKREDNAEYYGLGNFSLPCHWSSEEELATFSLKAGSIVGAIDNSKLEFSRDGLKITNGGLLITNQIEGNEETLVEFDENGELILKGKIYASGGSFQGELNAATGTFNGEVSATGIFSGTLEAATGSFSGEIIANSGLIKDLIIGDKAHSHLRLYTSNTEENSYYGGIAHFDKTEENNEISNFSIDLNGHIIANSITLNKGTIGDISFEDSTIKSNSWSISPEVAVFDNIIAQGKITTAIFDKHNIQLCGGSFLFKNGTFLIPIEISENTSIKSIGPVEDLLEDTLYILTNRNRTATSFCTCKFIYDDTNKVLNDVELHFIGQVDNASYDLLIEMGSLNNNEIQDWLIGVNSTSTNLINNGLSANSITLSTIEAVTNSDSSEILTYNFKPKIILGKIPTSIFPEQTYGLYAESAFLSGTLTTQFKSDGITKYAGVNTLNGATFAKNSNKLSAITEDTSRIIFWAGSDDTTSEKIQEAKFQVTENGTLYATQGLFTGSIITDSIIEASKISTAEIIGKDDGIALTIEDADIGIDFKDSNDQTVMLVSTGQMMLNMPLIFTESISGIPNIKNANIFGKKIGFSDTQNQQGITINANSLDFFNFAFDESNFLNLQHGNYYFNLEKNTEDVTANFCLNYYYQDKNKAIIKIMQDEEINFISNFSSSGDVYLGMQEDRQYTAAYKTVLSSSENSHRIIGLDLYIEEITIS